MTHPVFHRARQAIGRLTLTLPALVPSGREDRGRYDRLIDAANRLPRPLLVFGTLALFGLALVDPATFDRIMESLRTMPEELWWLAGAIFAGHFGAREAHHLRERRSRTAVSEKAPATESGQ
jgi:hypothetical protein